MSAVTQAGNVVIGAEEPAARGRQPRPAVMAPATRTDIKRRHDNAGIAPALSCVAVVLPSPHWVISTSLVSRRNNVPTTNVISAITTGYHSP